MGFQMIYHKCALWLGWGQRSDREIFCLIFFPVGILEIFFSRLRVCGKKIRLGCQWVQGFQGRYMQCGCVFQQLTVKKGNLTESAACI